MNDKDALKGDFRALVLARVCFGLATQAQSVIVGWAVYTLTHNPLDLGLLGLTEAIPAISLSLLSGFVVDRAAPYRTYRGAIALLFCNMLFLCALFSKVIWVSPRALLFSVYCAVFVSGAVRSIVGPSVFSLIPKIVPRHLIPTSSAWLSSAFQIAAVLGPTLGGLIYGFAGARAAFAFPVTLMALAWLGLGAVKSETRALRNLPRPETAWVSIRSGIQFVLRNDVILGAITLDMFSVFFGGAAALLPAFADQILHVGSPGLGVLRAATSVGSFFSAVWLARRPFKKATGNLLLFVVTGYGISMLGFGLSRVFWLSVLCLILSGAFDGVSMVLRTTLIQLRTPDEMRGRVSSVNSVFITSSNEIGAFESGVAAKLLGVAPSVVFGGLATLAVVAVTAVWAKGLRKARIAT